MEWFVFLITLGMIPLINTKKSPSKGSFPAFSCEINQEFACVNRSHYVICPLNHNPSELSVIITHCGEGLCCTPRKQPCAPCNINRRNKRQSDIRKSLRIQSDDLKEGRQLFAIKTYKIRKIDYDRNHGDVMWKPSYKESCLGKCATNYCEDSIKAGMESGCLLDGDVVKVTGSCKDYVICHVRSNQVIYERGKCPLYHQSKNTNVYRDDFNGICQEQAIDCV